jgi:hypothetical protein
MYTLLTGWFSFDTAEVTAGDLLAGATVRRWLDEAAVPNRVAMAANFRRGEEVDWTAVDPAEISHVVFTCGPAAGPLVEQLVARFPTATRVLVGVSVVDGTARLAPDVVIERDSPARSSPDLSLATSSPQVPVVGVIYSHEQPEYADRQRHVKAHLLLDDLMVASDVAPVVVDTRLHPGETHLCATPAQFESVLGRLDAVVTTRLHGLVLALKAGVPALAVDPISGGGKVIRQARAVGWPAAVEVDEVTSGRLAELLAWCLTPEARETAARCADAAHRRLEDSRAQLLAALR